MGLKTKICLLFSASHVILRTVKAVPEYGKRKPKHSTVRGEGEEVKPPPQAIPDENGNKVRFCGCRIIFLLLSKILLEESCNLLY